MYLSCLCKQQKLCKQDKHKNGNAPPSLSPGQTEMEQFFSSFFLKHANLPPFLKLTQNYLRYPKGPQTKTPGIKRSPKVGYEIPASVL